MHLPLDVTNDEGNLLSKITSSSTNTEGTVETVLYSIKGGLDKITIRLISILLLKPDFTFLTVLNQILRQPWRQCRLMMLYSDTVIPFVVSWAKSYGIIDFTDCNHNLY